MVLGLCNALVALFPWSAEFLREYLAEKHRLQDCIGVSSASFEHIGSTAVPGLAAKPIIDIMITVYDPDQQLLIASALTEWGYTCLGECGRPGRIFLVRGIRACLTTHHIHLVLDGSTYQTNHLAIREALVADTVLVAEYAELKLRLAGEYPLNRMMYRFYKGIFLEKHIMQNDKKNVIPLHEFDYLPKTIGGHTAPTGALTL